MTAKAMCLRTLFRLENKLQAYLVGLPVRAYRFLMRWKLKTQIYVNLPTSRCQRSIVVKNIATEVLSVSLEVESLMPSQWDDHLIHIDTGAKSCRKMFVFTNRASIAATQPFKNVETLKNGVIHLTETE